MIGNVPDRNDRDTQFGVRSGIAAFDTVEHIVRRERGEDNPIPEITAPMA